MIVAIDPGEKMGFAFYTEDKRYHHSTGLHANSYIGIYEEVNRDLDHLGARVTEAFLEDQYLKSPRIIGLAHNAGIVLACLIAHGCRVFHWRLPKTWKSQVSCLQRRKIIQRRDLALASEDEVDAVCMGWTCGLGRFK